MEHAPAKKTQEFKSESSIINHPYHFPKANQAKLPTWSLLVVLFVAFFILKGFIYISDSKRHGK